MPASIASIRDVLRDHPGITKQELLQHLRDARERTSIPELTAQLYSNPDWFQWSNGRGYERVWLPGPGGPRAAPRETPWSRTRFRHQWMGRALDRWHEADCKGLVQAVRGSGGVPMAVEVMRFHLERRWRICVVASSRDMQQLWMRTLDRHFICATRFSGETVAALAASHLPQVLVGTPDSPWRDLEASFPTLLVLDESAERVSRELGPSLGGVRRSLALSPVYIPADAPQRALPFGPVCYRVEYGEALASGVMAPFRLAFVGVRFSAAEKRAYDATQRACSETKLIFTRELGLTGQAFPSLHTIACQRAQDEDDDVAQRWLAALELRRRELARVEAKLARLSSLQQVFARTRGSVLFVLDPDSADATQQRLGLGRGQVAITSLVDEERRERILIVPEDNAGDLVATPAHFSEHSHWPCRELAVLLSGPPTPAGLVDRLGFVLRGKRGARRRAILVLYVEGTVEDPRIESAEGFYGLVYDAAQDVRVFSAQAANSDVVRFFTS